MREWRKRLFSDPFHKKSRAKNSNKVLAAKRRKRDEAGLFYFEEKEVDDSEPREMRTVVKSN